MFALVTDLLDVEEHPALDLARAYPMRWGCETVIGCHKTDLGEGMPVLRSRDPEGVAQEMWALFAVYQATAQPIGAGVDATGLPPARSASRTPSQPRPTRSGLSPCQLDLALATFLLKLIDPRYHVRERPGPHQPPQNEESGDFPARKPGELSVTNVTRRIQLHLLRPLAILKARPSGAEPVTRARRFSAWRSFSLPIQAAAISGPAASACGLSTPNSTDAVSWNTMPAAF